MGRFSEEITLVNDRDRTRVVDGSSVENKVTSPVQVCWDDTILYAHPS